MSPDDTSTTRRAILASTGAIAFAGCAGRLSRNDDATTSDATTTASTGDSTDWAQMGRTAAQNGYAPELAAETEPSVAWETTVDGSLTTPTVVDDTVYVTRGAPAEDGPEASLEAYALDTGERRWSRSLDSEFEYNAPFSNHRPVVYDGAAYVNTSDEVASVDLETRDVRWRATMDPFFNHPPTVTDDGLYVTAGASVVALDHAGDERWRHTAEGRRSRVVAVDEDTAYAPLDGRLLAIDAASGELRWEHAPENGLFMATSVVADDSVVSVSFGGVESVSTDGTRQWLVDGPEEDLLRPVVGAGVAFAAGLYGTVTAYDLESGERLWQTNVGDGEWTQETAPILLDESVIVPQSDGTEVSVHALDVTSGEERWSVSASDARIRGPVAASGYLVTTSQDRHVNTREKTSESVPTGTIRAYEFEN